VFQSTDAVNRVVPVRSARTTDIALFTPLNHPLFAWSGANADFATLIRHSPIVDVGVDAQPGEYHRDHSRSPTHDLYTTTQGLWAHAPAGAVPPPPLFFYRALGQQLPADARPTPHAYVAFGSQVGSAPVDWYWDGGPGVWRRNQRGTPDVDETGQQVSPRNVIIQLVTYHDTGYVDTTGATVFEADLVGSGDCMLLTVGSVVPCRWWKPTPEAVTTYYDSTGAPLLLTPGQTWVELPWAGRAAVNVD
jgi:hypothetical protein